MLLYFKYFCLGFLQENKQWDWFRKTRERLLPGKKKTGADGRYRSLSLQRGSFAYYRKVPMVVKAAGESTGGEQLASVGKQLASGG